MPAQIGGGYAVGYGTTIPYILLAGVDLQEAHFKRRIPSTPATRR